MEGYTSLLISGNFPPYPLPALLLIFKKISILPVFSPKQMIFSILPAVIWAYPFVKFEGKLQPTLVLET